MGLRLSFDIDDLGLPAFLEDDDYGIVVPIDYSEAFEAFVDTFIDEACDLVPVDTGFLMSTIDGEAGNDECTVWASADYAQYVEYGTYKMDAQPYFVPAVEAANEVFMTVAMGLFDEAQEDLESQIEAAQEEEEGGGGGGGNKQADRVVSRMAGAVQQGAMTAATNAGAGFLGSIIAGAIALVILFPIAAIAYGVMDTLSGGSDRSHSGGRGGGFDSFSGGANLISMIEID